MSHGELASGHDALDRADAASPTAGEVVLGQQPVVAGRHRTPWRWLSRQDVRAHRGRDARERIDAPPGQLRHGLDTVQPVQVRAATVQ
jgi:hypothetical protein